MNTHAIRVMYRFEMARTWRTVTQSIVSPVLSTALAFVVFGPAIGARIEPIGDVSYGAFIVPGLIRLTVLTQSILNASFGIYFPKFSGPIYELLSAPISQLEVVFSDVIAAATKSVLVGLIILATASVFVPIHIAHPLDAAVPGAHGRDLQPVRFHHRHLGRRLREAATDPDADRDAAHLSRRAVLFRQHAASAVAKLVEAEPFGLPDQRLPLELFRQRGDARCHQLLGDAGVLRAGPHGRHLDHADGVAAEGLRVALPDAKSAPSRRT